MEKWQDPKVIALWIAIVMVLVFTIILFVVKIMHTGYKKMTEANLRQARLEIDHQKKLLETGLLAQEKERNRIATDLHDGLIGKLSVIRMKAQLAKTPEEIELMLGDSIAEARRISHDLMPPLIEFSSVAELLEGLLEPWRQKLHIDFIADVRTPAEVSPQAKIQIIRIVQELITNTVKHAGAAKVTVVYRHTGRSMALLVGDNGKGFDVSLLKNGLGLGSLEMRAQYLGGHCRIKSAPGKGTRAILLAKA
ncbi:sensor histidine kinase [Flavobacterium sp. RHBU_3]|uniref:sensor histidine kinase n=1 Tax=Flavobacterium sp. RHBU_3 TaxID=3391184 RepID=UPI003984DFA9